MIEKAPFCLGQYEHVEPQAHLWTSLWFRHVGTLGKSFTRSVCNASAC